MIQEYKHFITVEVYRNARHGDCTNGGASSKYDSLYLVHPLVTDEQIIEYCKATGEPADRFFRRGEIEYYIGQDYHYYMFLEPCLKNGRRHMNGGNIASTSDSRFREFTMSAYPLRIHDRTEG